jgi:F0F1-type ATP synthase assembly protein I
VALRRGPGLGGAGAGRGAEVAWEAALSMVLGALLGIWIDKRAGTSPIFLVVFVSLGLTVAVRRLLRFAKAQTAADAKAPPPPKPPDDFDPPEDRTLH